ncbi:hypothetical protein Tco_1386440 [Tanacetum coccineum]
MGEFSIFDSSFDHCLQNLEKMLKRYEETNLVLNWKKCHFMVKEGIFLGHKVSGSGIKVEKAKIEAISKLPYPTNMKAIRSFLGHVGFYRRFIKDFSQVARPMTHLLVKDTPSISLKNASRHSISIISKMSPSYSNNVHTKSYEDVSLDMRQRKSFDNVIAARQEGIMASPQLDGKSLKSDSTGPISSAMYANWSELVMHVNELVTFLRGMRHPKNTSKSENNLTFGG